MFTPNKFLSPIIISVAIGGRRWPSVRKIVWCELGFKAGSHRKDYERIKLKTDLRLVKMIKSECKPFHICLKNMFSNNLN